MAGKLYPETMDRPKALKIKDSVVTFQSTWTKIKNTKILGLDALMEYLFENQISYTIDQLTDNNSYIHAAFYGSKVTFEDKDEALLCYLRYC